VSYRRCAKQLMRELCWLRAGTRRITSFPAYMTDEVRRIIQKLGVKPGVVFADIGGIPTGIVSLDYALIGELSSKLLCGELSEPRDPDILLGRYHGYPDCCIRAFRDDGCFGVAWERYKEQLGSGRDPFRLETYEDGEGWIWVFGYITHVPCSPECEQTKRIHEFHRGLCRECRDKLCEKLYG